MNEPRTIPPRPRDRLFAAVTLVLAVLLLPAAFLRHPGRAREWACRWALRLRFPAEDLTGLTDGALRGPDVSPGPGPPAAVSTGRSERGQGYVAGE
ncbi:hypothetical protein [Nonomuraea aurantiaca]|uniref:hypothetical protein n=1 Tax=Nonomuraea aurantiaca TaxID=2878562 RepID=UPI001CDA0250|nr:hypothetical protein [Nonomuraea aurantiaca]MCA2226297.1 hypothetical protein [Nonomuraea aurantiaca]